MVSPGRLLKKNSKFTEGLLAGRSPSRIVDIGAAGEVVPGRACCHAVTVSRRSADLALGDDLAALDLVGVDLHLGRLTGLVERQLLGDAGLVVVVDELQHGLAVAV